MTNMEKIQICQEIVNRIQLESRRPVCYLRLIREPFTITDSHLGGVPYVPHDGKIPTDNDGNQLWLCAQINFAQMPQMPGFPESGLLQIFLEDWHFGDFGLDVFNMDQDYWRVVYYSEIDETVTMEECRIKMVIPWEEAKRSNMPRPANNFDLADIKNGYDFLWRCPDIPLRILFQSVEQEGVNHEDFRFDTLFAKALTARLPDADPNDFMPYNLRDDIPEEREVLNEVLKQIRIGGCKLGGYPRYYQDDPRLYSEEYGKPLEEWDILLFQLDDDLFTFPAGDRGDIELSLNGGTLNFVIRPEDLKKRDFSQVLAQWACT